MRRMHAAAVLAVAVVLAVTGFAPEGLGASALEREWTHAHYLVRNHTPYRAGPNLRREHALPSALRADLRRLRRLLARNQANAPVGWAIPTYIVMCESGGRNLSPNGAGASGYYQIIPSTWQSHGGGRFASEAYLATKAEQSIVALAIWNSDGPSQWDCA